MSTGTAVAADTRPAYGRLLGPAIAGCLVVSLAAAALLGPPVGLGLMVVGTLALARPFDPLFAAVLTTMTATLVDYHGGQLTLQLGVVTLFTGYALFCMLVSAIAGRWSFPRGSAIAGLAIFGATTAASTAFGLAQGNSLKYLGLDLSPLVGLVLAVVVGGLRLERFELRFVMALLMPIGLFHVGYGLFAYAVKGGGRLGGLYFTQIPGLLALVLLNLELHREGRIRWWPVVLMALLLVHQLISYTRGYWLGLAVGFLVSAVLFVFHRGQIRRRAGRVGTVISWLGLLSITGLLVIGAAFGWADVFEILGTRLVSSVGVAATSETASNLTRIIEYSQVLQHITRSPWIGHGLGYTIYIKQPLMSAAAIQGMFHQIYLWVWVKQGAIGLVGFVFMLWAALRGHGGQARRADPVAAAWGAAACACTANLAAVGLTNYSFGVVNNTFLLGLIWGIALSLRDPERPRLVWRSHQDVPARPA